MGLLQEIQEVSSPDNATYKRDSLGLPPLSKPEDMSKFQAWITKMAIDKI